MFETTEEEKKVEVVLESEEEVVSANTEEPQEVQTLSDEAEIKNERKSPLPRFEIKNLGRTRRVNELRILSEEELKNQKESGGSLARRDALKSPLSPQLKRFAKENYFRVRELVSKRIDSRREQEEQRIGQINVTPLLEGSSKGQKRAYPYRQILEFQTAKKLLEEFEKVYPSKGQSQSKKESRTQELVNKFGSTPFDTGATAVQIALQTQRIESLKAHFQTHKKDLHSKRGFVQLIQKRKALLKYLKRKHQDEYEKLLVTLNLRK